MNAYFARQPILDSKLQLYGYELLFRPSPHSNTSGDVPALNGDSATSSVLSAMEWAGIEKVTGKRWAFVNFTERLLLEGVAQLYPKEFLMVEILETIDINDRIINAIKELKAKGYKIALDDYEFRDEHHILFPLCDVIKVEVDGSPKCYENLQRVARAVELGNCKILAEKVESQEVYERARDLGCTLFQGYFFAKPKLVKERTVNPLKANQLRLLNAVSRPNVDFESLAKIIKSDIALTYKILQIVNSPYYGLKNKVQNINQAVLLLGIDDIKKWLTLSVMNGLGDDKPSELVIMSLVRALFYEQFAKTTGYTADAESYFLAGLFSLLDSLTDMPLDVCLNNMPIASVTKQLLLQTNSWGSDMLGLIIAMEHGEWTQVEQHCQKLKVGQEQVARIYLNAVEWAQAIL